MLPKDDAMLLSLANMKLRDGCASLEELCEELEAERTELEARLLSFGYVYDEAGNRFVPVL